MDRVLKVDLMRALFAAGLVLASAAIAGAVLGKISERAITAIVAILGALSVAGWVLFALDPSTGLGLPAGGLTLCTLIAVGAIGVRRGTFHARKIEREITRAEARLAAQVTQGADQRAAELERVLARARAESLSLIAAEERRIVESRRDAITEHERASSRELTDALAETQRRVEQRFAAWTEDLERAQANLHEQLQRLAGRQKRLIEEAEERLAADAERLESESEGQRAALVKLREEVAAATEKSIESARADLDGYAVERRQALAELTERLRTRERELREALEREQSEAMQSIQSMFTDVERRLVERLERVVERSTAQHVDVAAMQFSEAIKRSREDSAKRLARELERAVESFTHQADALMNERLQNVGQAAVQRLERRLSDADAAVDARRNEVALEIEQKFAAAQNDLRQRLDDLAADSEAERAVLEARMFDLQRRLDAALAHAESLES
jgi:hypothetical protein